MMNPSTTIMYTESPTTNTIIISSTSSHSSDDDDKNTVGIINNHNNNINNNDDDNIDIDIDDDCVSIAITKIPTTTTKTGGGGGRRKIIMTNNKEQKSFLRFYSYYKPKPWHHALYHTTTSVLCGCVVASFPLGFAYLQLWWGSITLFVASTLFTFYSGWCLIELQTLEDKTYSDIANRCMMMGNNNNSNNSNNNNNPNFANRYVRPFQLFVFVVVTVLMVLIIGWGYTAFDKINADNSTTSLLVLSQSGWIGIGGITLLIFSAFIPKLSQQWILSAAGTISGIAITVMIIVGSAISIVEGGEEEEGSSTSSSSSRENEATTNFFGRSFDTTAEYVFGVFNAFGIIALAYGGHSILPDIQSSLNCNYEEEGIEIEIEKQSTVDADDPTTKVNTTTVTTVEQKQKQQQRQSQRQKEMKKGLIGAYCIIAPCYLLAGVLGYVAFGSHVTGFVIDDISSSSSVVHVDDTFIILAWIFLIINAIAIGCVYGQAAFTLIEDIIFTTKCSNNNNNNNRTSGRSSQILPQEAISVIMSKTEVISEVEPQQETAENNNNNEDAESPAINTTTSFQYYVIPRTYIRHVFLRIIYVSICTLIAAAFPFFADLGGLIGAIGFIPLTFVYPLIFWNYSANNNNNNKADVDVDVDDNAANANNKNKHKKWRIYFNWIMIVCWTIIGICGMIGSTYFIIQDSSTFGIFPN